MDGKTVACLPQTPAETRELSNDAIDYILGRLGISSDGNTQSKIETLLVFCGVVNMQ
jgi:hypothetical protein